MLRGDRIGSLREMKTILIRLDEDDFDVFARAADLRSQPLSSWIRGVALDAARTEIHRDARAVLAAERAERARVRVARRAALAEQSKRAAQSMGLQ